MSGHGKWVWSTDEERFNGGGEHSREAAEAGARAELEPGEKFWTGRMVCPLERVHVHADGVLEQIGLDACDRVDSDVVGAWPHTALPGRDPNQDRLSEELTKLVVAYLREHDAPSFFGVEDVEEHVAGEGVPGE